jgi:hypothetical protein
VPADAPRQVFRPSPPNYVIGWVVTIVFVLLGLGFVVGGLTRRAWFWPEFTGVVLLLLAVYIIRAMATSALVATPAELVYWDWRRRRSLAWTEIRSIGVGRGRSRSGWPAVIITLNTGTRIRTVVTAYRRSYPARIAAELTALHRQYAPPPPASPGSDQSPARMMTGVGALSVAAGLALAGIRVAQFVRRNRTR